MTELKKRNVENSLMKEETMVVDVQNVKEGNVYFCSVCKKFIQDDGKSYNAQSVQYGKCQFWYLFP